MTKPVWALYREINIAMKKGKTTMQEISDFVICSEVGISQEQLDMMVHEDVLKWCAIMSRRGSN